MAQTKKQAEKELLKQAQALLAKQKKQLANLQSQQESLNPTPTRVNTTTLAGIQAASQPTVVAQTDDEAWARKKVGTTGKTQAQLDAAAGAADVVKMINESYSGLGISSKIDPKTGMVVTTQDGKRITNNPPPPPGGGGDDGGDDEPDKPKEISDATRDAFAALTDLFASYGLESLAGEIAGYMTQGLTAAEALIKLKTNPGGAYAKRFAGNFTRVKNGLNAISEAAYIGLENSYASTLKSYGLGNMVSLNREDNYKKFADYIAGDISADEFKDRVDTVVTRVQNADASIKSTLKAFYPEITDADLIGYFLNPKENLPKLQEKVTASEIGAAATGMGLATNVGTATDLARYGIDKAEAREGYSTIAGVLPTATKLGDIYNESGIKYAQAEGEAEVFKGSQDAATKRKRLASMERAAFGGSSGTGQSSLTRSTQGRL
jgi:hypothetical protein